MANLTSSVAVSLSAKRYGEAANLFADALALTGEADEMSSQFLSIVTGTVDQAVDLGPLTSGSILMLISDQTVGVKLNDAVTALPVQALFLATTAVTALSLSNASGVTAKVRLYVLGA